MGEVHQPAPGEERRDPRTRPPSAEQVAECFERIGAITDPLERRYVLLREARKLGVEEGELESLLADYALGRRTQGGYVERSLYRLARWFEERSIFEVLEYFGRLAILVAILSFFLGLPERRAQQREARWQSVMEAAGAHHHGNRQQSLEWLNRQCFPMDGLRAPGAQLAGLDLDGCRLLAGRLRLLSGSWFSRLPTVYRDVGAELRGAVLADADLTGARLRGAVLTSADLHGAQLHGADLRGADLRGADLSSAELHGADLTAADLRQADLTGADLFRANLTAARLHESVLCSARFVGSRLTGAELHHARGCPQGGPQGETGPPPAAVSFAAADLRSTQFYAADLRGAGFRRSRLNLLTAFDEALLEGATFDPGVGLGGGLFAGARSVPPSVAESKGRAADPTLRLGLLIPERHHFFNAVEEGVRRAAREAGGEVEVRLGMLPVADGQVETLERFARQCDAVLLRATGFALETLTPVRDTGVTLACYDQCPDSGWGEEVFVASYETEDDPLGHASGLALREWWRRRQAGLPPELPLLVYRSCLGEGCFQRLRGLRRALGERREAADARLREADYRVLSAAGEMADACELLRRHPGPAVLWAANETGTQAAVEAVYDLGRQGEVWVFGIDLSPTLAAMLMDRRDVLQAMVAQDPEAMAHAAAERALAAASGALQPYERRTTGFQPWSRRDLESRDRWEELHSLADSAPSTPPRRCPSG